MTQPLNLFQTLLPFYQLVPLHCGPSQPTGDLSLSSLRHLSSSQALADAARFVTHVTREYSLPPNTKWVSFGGSYPGMMAGWLRLKYPHLVHASVASSAPVQASLEMRGYNDVIAASLAEADVGGSAACVRNVRGAFLELSAKLSSSDGRREVEKNFNVCDNDKRGYAHCDPDVVPMFHKWPAWESSRIEALWTAAQAGECQGNRRLLDWRSPSAPSAGASPSHRSVG